MNRKIVVCVVTGALVLGGVIGLGLTRASTAEAGAQADQSPAYTSSIQVPNAQDNANEKEDAKAENGAEKETGAVENKTDDGSAGEASEAASLQAQAKITPDQAKAAALKAVPGTVLKAELENENGNLVYGVEIKTADGDVDVKVDAGNGTVLAQDSQHDDCDKAQGNDNEKDSGAQDNDNVQDQSGDQSGD